MYKVKAPVNKGYLSPYYGGMDSLGTKNPLVKPATLEMTGERRNAIFGKAQMTKMSRATQVWLRARLTSNTWPKTQMSYDSAFTSYRRGWREGQ